MIDPDSPAVTVALQKWYEDCGGYPEELEGLLRLQMARTLDTVFNRLNRLIEQGIAEIEDEMRLKKDIQK